jgi:hypothetical protein
MRNEYERAPGHFSRILIPCAPAKCVYGHRSVLSFRSRPLLSSINPSAK